MGLMGLMGRLHESHLSHESHRCLRPSVISVEHEEDQRLLAPGFWLLAPFPSAVASIA